MVILEGLAISLISFVLAIPLSVPFSLALGDAIGREFWMRPLEYTFSWVGMLLWLVLVVIIAILASLLPARNAAHLTIRETLVYEG
jgi:putative ABC transport system permease protein